MGGSRASGSRVAGGDWHAAPVPCPWLTRAALTVAALYAVLADGPRTWPAARGTLARAAGLWELAGRPRS